MLNDKEKMLFSTSFAKKVGADCAVKHGDFTEKEFDTVMHYGNIGVAKYILRTGAPPFEARCLFYSFMMEHGYA